MSEYESETPEQLLIRQQRGQASNVSLTSPNVRRVYDDFRQVRPPTGRSMASHSGHEDYVGAMLNALMPVTSASTMTAAVGVGSSAPVTVPAGTAAVGVRTSAVPSTSRVRTATVPSTSGTRTTSRGKEPRAVRRSRSRSRSGTPSSDEQRRRATREATRRRFEQLLRERRGEGGDGGDDGGDGDGGGGGGGGGGSDGDGGGSDGRRSRRGRRRRGGMHDNLDDLLEALRRRTGGRHIAGITHTDTITTTYKDGRPPTVHRTSSRASGSQG